MSEEPPGRLELEESLGYHFRDPGLLARALTHPSCLQTGGGTAEHYQRLEFLGDAVLTLILAEALFQLLPDEREGVLTQSRSALAKGEQLSALARDLGIPAHLRMSEAEAQNGGRERASILEDALEAIIGAIYLDGSLERCREVVLGWLGNLEERLESYLATHNPKGRLQEKIQPTLGNDAIDYRLIEAAGPDHAKVYTVEIAIAGKTLGQGTGTSKKEAEEAAARVALRNWQEGES